MMLAAEPCFVLKTFVCEKFCCVIEKTYITYTQCTFSSAHLVLPTSKCDNYHEGFCISLEQDNPHLQTVLQTQCLVMVDMNNRVITCCIYGS